MRPNVLSVRRRVDFGDACSIPTAGFSNCGFIALELIGHGHNPVARSPSQDYSSALHLKPRQSLAPSDLREIGFVDGTNAGSVGASAAHGRMSPGNLVNHCQLTMIREFRAAILSRDTRTADSMLRARSCGTARARTSWIRPRRACRRPWRVLRSNALRDCALATRAAPP